MPTILLDTLDLGAVIQGWETAKAGRGVAGAPLSIGGTGFTSGIGTHAVSTIDLALDGRCSRFEARVGVDDVVGARGLGRVHFLVLVDGRVAFDGGIREGGQEALPVSVDLGGARCLRLLAEAPGDQTHHGHADWAEARISYDGEPPRIVLPERGEPLRFPAADPRPRFLGGLIVGARPGHPVIHRLPCIGAGELRFEVTGLPDGLSLDPEEGVLRGRAPTAGSYPIGVTARNADGETSATLRLKVGDGALAPLPPMGWNSWNGYGHAVTQADVSANHRALVDRGLHRYGYRYLTIDDGWQGDRATADRSLRPNGKFPAIAELAEAIHVDGLLAGLYSVACTWSPQGLMGGSGDHPDGTTDTPFVHGERRPIGPCTFFGTDVARWAAWGFDFVKIDCQPPPEVIREFAAAIRGCGRDILISLSANFPPETLPGYRGNAQLWRTTGDLIDTWPSVRGKLRSQPAFSGEGGPGGWNDADMLVVGACGPGWNVPRQETRLTWRERALHVGMWHFLASPLFLGCDLAALDRGTLELVTRPGLIDLNQDALGAAATCVHQEVDTGLMHWTRPLADGDVVVALVNLGEEPVEALADLPDLGRDAADTVTDCWTEEGVPTDRGHVAVELAPHDHRVYRVSSSVQ